MTQGFSAFMKSEQVQQYIPHHALQISSFKYFASISQLLYDHSWAIAVEKITFKITSSYSHQIVCILIRKAMVCAIELWDHT